ncbi:unnamed protein product, partial [marine sediment metagenome]
ERNCLIWKGLGVRVDGLAHLYKTYLKIGEYDHPKGGIFTERDQNPLHYGHIFPAAPATEYYFLPIPKLAMPHYIYNEIGEAVILDDGTAIAADEVVLAMNGTLVTVEEWGG